jgi:hypothetical protein
MAHAPVVATSRLVRRSGCGVSCSQVLARQRGIHRSPRVCMCARGDGWCRSNAVSCKRVRLCSHKTNLFHDDTRMGATRTHTRLYWETTGDSAHGFYDHNTDLRSTGEGCGGGRRHATTVWTRHRVMPTAAISSSPTACGGSHHQWSNFHTRLKSFQVLEVQLFADDSRFHFLCVFHKGEQSRLKGARPSLSPSQRPVCNPLDRLLVAAALQLLSLSVSLCVSCCAQPSAFVGAVVARCPD